MLSWLLCIVGMAILTVEVASTSNQHNSPTAPTIVPPTMPPQNSYAPTTAPPTLTRGTPQHKRGVPHTHFNYPNNCPSNNCPSNNRSCPSNNNPPANKPAFPTSFQCINECVNGTAILPGGCVCIGGYQGAICGVLVLGCESTLICISNQAIYQGNLTVSSSSTAIINSTTVINVNGSLLIQGTVEGTLSTNPAFNVSGCAFLNGTLVLNLDTSLTNGFVVPYLQYSCLQGTFSQVDVHQTKKYN